MKSMSVVVLLVSSSSYEETKRYQEQISTNRDPASFLVFFSENGDMLLFKELFINPSPETVQTFPQPRNDSSSVFIPVKLSVMASCMGSCQPQDIKFR